MSYETTAKKKRRSGTTALQETQCAIVGSSRSLLQYPGNAVREVLIERGHEDT